MRTTKHRLAAALLALALMGGLAPPARAITPPEPEVATIPLGSAQENRATQDTPQAKNSIIVHKHFENLPTMDTLPTNFAIFLKNADGTIAYKLDVAGVNGESVFIVGEDDSTSDEENDVPLMVRPDSTDNTWSWRVYVPDGNHTYSISESGYQVDGYTVSASYPPTVSTTATSGSIEWVTDSDNKKNPQEVQVNGNNNKVDVGSINLMWFHITGGDASLKDYTIIWTRDDITASERQALLSKISTEGSGNQINTAKVIWYAGNDAMTGDGLIVKESVIKYDGEFLTILAKQFNVAYTANYTYKPIPPESDGAEVEIINTYTPHALVTVSKTVKGEYGDTTESFDFTMTLDGGALTPGAYTDENGIAYTVAGNGTTVTFSLTHGQSILIPLPQGCKVTVSENSNGYDTTVNKVIGTSATVESLGAGGAAFDFVNELPYSPDTGITLDALPYVLILIGVGAAAAVLLLRKRRRDDGEEW